MDLHKIVVRPVFHSEESFFRTKMQDHHYLGSLLKIGNTIWYVATYHEQW